MGRTRKMEGKSKRQADRIRSEQQCDGRSDSQKSPPSAVNFDLLDYDALERLAIHYGIQPYYADRRALVHAVSLGFNSEQVSENEALTAFLSKELFQGKWRSISKATRAITSKVPSRTKLLKKRVREATYNEMIQGALQRLPGQQGTLEEIYYVIEQRHSRTLNFECEAGSRRIPVWKASVRKIINLNESQFPRLIQAGQAVFRLAPITDTLSHPRGNLPTSTEADDYSPASSSTCALCKTAASASHLGEMHQ